jgi:hypothetical protein
MSTKSVIIIAAIILVGIQFFRPKKNISPKPSPANIATLYAVPEGVDTLLRNACYDCHSNNTTYPWYANFQPVYWWLNNHIEEGKRHLNFDEFASYKIGRQYKKLDDIADEIQQGDMPLPVYVYQHKEAHLTAAQKELIYNWCSTLRDNIRLKYPADSLGVKK